jgi:pSer/pThr/pTyr-binding forkhead associated (FHA) protein
VAFSLTLPDGKKYDFDVERVTIGRGGDNDIVLYDAGVSRNHARIERSGNAWVLADNGSSNGTELNGRVIALAATLQNGDRIGVGPVRFQFGSAGSSETRITSRAKVAEPIRPPPRPGDGETRVTKTPLAEGKAVEPRAGGKKIPSLKEVWAKLPRGGRIGTVAMGALVVALVAFALVRNKEPEHGMACPETVAVDDDTANYTFGHGGVDVDCGDEVAFGFNAPAQTRVLFHYLATHVASPSEVEARVNGKHLAWAPVAGARGDAQVITLPADAQGGALVVQFTQSVKGKEWSIAKVRVETFAITPGDLNAARAAYERGRRKLEERRIAPRNLYEAWRSFTESRRQMEGLAPEPPLYAEVAQLINDCERDLDKECSRLLFTAGRFERYGQDEKAQQTYREVLLHFPGEDPTGCRKKAQANIVSAPAEANQQ